MRVSVVIPAFNAQDVLGGCLDSVCRQTGPELELELVVVDDGSTDATLALARSRAAQDARLRVLTQPNGGVSSARNAGLAAATGDVVLFVDADDALEAGALAYVASCFEAESLDCLVFGMRIEPEAEAPLTLSHRLAPRDALIEDDPRRLIFAEASHPYAFRVAFSRAFLDACGLRFDTRLSLGEDEAFLLVAYRLARRVRLSSRQLYVYRMSDASASHRDNASAALLPKKLSKHLDVIEAVLGEWRLRGFDASCDRDVLDWALDLVMLDASRLMPGERARVFERLWQILCAYFGPDGGRSYASAAAAPCVRYVQRVAFGARLRDPLTYKVLLVRLYLHTRGVSAVAERALASLRGRGAY